MISPVQYLKEVVTEMQRVSWPAPKIVAYHTAIVVVSMIAIIVVVGGFDSLLVKLVQYMLLKG